MTTWRVANRRKGRRLHLATVESYLGDVRDEPPAPMRPVYIQRRNARCWVQRGTHLVLACTAAVAFMLLLSIHLLMLFAYYPATPFSLQ